MSVNLIVGHGFDLLFFASWDRVQNGAVYIKETVLWK
jgi:hypothetical protein